VHVAIYITRGEEKRKRGEERRGREMKRRESYSYLNYLLFYLLINKHHVL